MFGTIARRLFGTANERFLKGLNKNIAAINALEPQIEALRDSGKIVHLYGTLLSNVPDYNGSQIQVDRIEVEE